MQQLDLASLASVRAAAADLLGQDRPIDALVNNAEVMAIPTRQVTIDGWETQFATTYLGHLALTGLVLPLLRRGVRARVVYLGSMTGVVRSASPGQPQRRARRPRLDFGKTHAGPDTLENRIAGFFGVVMDPVEGGLGTIRAASDLDVLGGRYYSPTGFGGTLGSPGVVRQPPPARNAEAARRLWERSVDLIGVDYGGA